MKVLVTGGAGFIGSNTCEYLLNKGYTVISIDSFNNYYPRKIKNFNLESFANNPKFKMYEGNIGDRQFIEKVLRDEKPEGLIHLAAWAGVTDSVEEPAKYVYENVDGTNNLVELGVKYGLKTVVFASTSSVYGNKNTTPFTETMNTDFPAAPYPASKKACEVLLYTYSLNFKINSVIFRIFNPIGPKMRPDLALPKLVRSAMYNTPFELWMDPNVSMRDYAYIEQMIEVFEKALNKNVGYEVYNLGNSDPRSLASVKDTVEKVVGNKISTIDNYKPGQMKETYADISKAKTAFGYNPKFTMEEMIKKYYDWFIKQPDWYKKGEY